MYSPTVQLPSDEILCKGPGYFLIFIKSFRIFDEYCAELDKISTYQSLGETAISIGKWNFKQFRFFCSFVSEGAGVHAYFFVKDPKFVSQWASNLGQTDVELGSLNSYLDFKT